MSDDPAETMKPNMADTVRSRPAALQRRDAIVRYVVSNGLMDYTPFVVHLKPIRPLLRIGWKREKQINAQRIGARPADLEAAS